jgi:hypothetical protein
MKAKAWWLLLFTALIISTGCKKNSSTKKTNTELLTQSTWRYDHSGLDLDNNGTIDSPVPAGMLQSCDTDNTISFNTGGTGVLDEGATKCNAANPQTVPFTWSFKNNESIINFSNVVFGGLTGDVKMISLNDTQLTLEKDVTYAVGVTVNVIIVLKH